MAEFDFDLFIDNVLKNKSNAELMQIERMPAQEVRKLSPEDIAKNVEYGEVPLPIEYPQGYKPKVPQSEIIRQNVNPVLQSQQQSMNDLALNLKDMSGQYSDYKGQMQDALANLQSASQKKFESPDLDKRIASSQEDYSAIKDVPERDLLTEAILSFGPAVFGALGGESAQIAQLPAGQKAREMYEGRRKEDIDRVKQLREQADKRYKTLVEMKKTQQESFDKSQQREMDRLKAVLSGSGDLAKMSGDELKTTEQRLLDLQKDIAKGTTEGATEIAKMERGADLEENKEKRAKIMAQLAQQKIDKPTEGERKGAFQLGLMEQANQNLKDLKGKYGALPSMTNKWFRTQKNIASGMFGTTLMSDLLNSSIIDEPTRQQIQAELAFLESIGRIQSGAAINIGEWNTMREPYFETQGDSPESVRMKEKQRETALEGVRVIAGKAAPLAPKSEKVISNDSFPRYVYKGNQRATVQNEKELKEANAEGYK